MARHRSAAGTNGIVLKNLRHHYGSPISRARVYILMARRALMTESAKVNFASFATSIADKLKEEPSVKWYLAAIYHLGFASA